MKIGVFLPSQAPGEIRASARFAEEAGLDSLWATDHLVASGPILDSTVALATAAAVTERITIGYGVLLLALRRVAVAAKQISALQLVSAGRLAVGVGTGNPAHGDAGWRAAGTSFSGRGRRTDEALRVLPALVTGRRAVLDDGLEVALAPGSAMPPVLVGGNGERAWLRAAQFGDGWISIGSSPEDVAAGLQALGDLAAGHGRPVPRATVVAPALDGSPAKAAERLAAYAEAGAERVILAPGGEGWRPGYDFAAEVRAALGSRA
ncbi:LLM class flavin-dependent oxidoreductase [Prauserella sp. PE36]|uniref:LLM class flavin-dependent oxidoreductase n=1 Tax=Prauserella endophytica TaxID=1592324 RepID=A0ABY2SA03_9PSEU|nr:MULTISPECIES: LLM class flavin-dependent oxidoreductase [Prauserella]RBM21068.1 LLM class flavin-dependent oxidoreductase [Prauserella sp. PE36]TKG72149.1 LLM class flavin-dependent oxidoreductase [Prauserella endophytica]